MSSRRSDRLGFVAVACVAGLGCASGRAPGPDPEPASEASAPQTIVEVSAAPEPAATEIDWLALADELVGPDGAGSRDAAVAKANLCVAGCDGPGPYLVDGSRDPGVRELWAVALRDGVRVRAPAVRVVSDAACEQSIVELEFGADVGGVSLYLAVDAPACGSGRGACQTYIEDAELVAGGPPSLVWPCNFGP